MELSDGARVGVIGGGPAGSLTSYFLLELAHRVGMDLQLDIYEPKDFARIGPASCNMCGGIVSESLVQMLATEGINLPASVVQRGIDSYVLHTDGGAVRIPTPLEEMRIACVHRGGGPRGSQPGRWESFDGFLLGLACEKGARHIPARVEQIGWEGGRPAVRARGKPPQRYDLVIGAVGVNSPSLKLFRRLGFGFREPTTTRAYIVELHLGSETVQACLGSSMHVFLLNIPGLEFAALIPKQDYITACLLGQNIDKALLERFMRCPEVRQCLPADWSSAMAACRCAPKLNVGAARPCFADRVVLVGDCGVSRLYKDGIGAAYRAAKACAVTAVFHGVSRQAFQKHYWPACRRLELDNMMGRLLFAGLGICREMSFLRRAILQTTQKEQGPNGDGKPPIMNMILWDMFTGSARYANVVLRGLRPTFVVRFATECLRALMPGRDRKAQEHDRGG